MKFLHKPDNASGKRAAARRALLRRSTRRRRAMTLIELLVSVAILSIMILLFSSILADSQKVVAVSQDTMHANAKAAAIAEIIRNDIRRITQNGFLHIKQLDDDTPVLVFTTAGVSPSSTGNGMGTGMVVCYGVTVNNAPGATGNILWRRALVLDPSAAVEQGDVMPMDLTDVLLESRASLETNIFRPAAREATDPPLNVPAQLSDIDNLWQCLTANCSDLSIMWTDGDDEPGTNDAGWYGLQEYAGNHYKLRTVPAELPEYLTPPPEERYRALWTRDPPITWPPDTPNNWPRAIRIRFVLTDDSVPEELGDTELGETVYEVICPIGM